MQAGPGGPGQPRRSRPAQAVQASPGGPGQPRRSRPVQAVQAGPGGPGRSRRSRPAQAVQAGPDGPGRSRPRLARPGYLGEALAEPYTVQAVSGRPCGRPSPPVEKTGSFLIASSLSRPALVHYYPWFISTPALLSTVCHCLLDNSLSLFASLGAVSGQLGLL